MTGAAPAWFRSPGRAFRTAAFWFWHRIPSEAEIRAQVADMRRTGIGAVMIQARPALPIDAYLSSAYLEAYRVAAAEVRRHGLGLTLYDEYGWMSGHGGGRTVRGADHLRERHMVWTSAPAGPGRTGLTITDIRAPFLDFLGEIGRDWLYDGGQAEWGDWRVGLVVAHPERVTDLAEITVLEAPGQVSAAGPRGGRLVIDHPALPAGTVVTAFLSARCLTSRLVNYLLPEAAERFAAVAYAPLLAAAGEAAEDAFFDHPHAGFYVWDERTGPLGNSLLSDGAPVPAAEAAALLALARDVGPRTAALRAGFLERYADRMHEAFFGTLSRWTAARTLGFTGHELLTHVGGWSLHDGLTGFDPRAMPGVDYFGIDRFRTATSVDAADFAPQLSAKLGDSVARAQGRSRCSVEQYATGRPRGRPTLAGQWDLTAETFRAQAIRHILSGARRIVLHAIAVSEGRDDARLLANPRFDFPPFYNFEPWWEDCPPIFDELARLSAFLEDGEPVRDVDLLYPLETIRVEGPGHACGVQFGWWAEALSRAGVGFDIVDERGLAAATGTGSRVRVLILPSAVALRDAASLDAIAAFVRGGGSLRVSGAMPALTRHGDGGLDLGPELGDRVIHRPQADAAEVARLVAALPRPRPSLRFLDGGPTWSAVSRVADGGTAWRLAAFNDADHPRALGLEVADDGIALRVWDAATGTVSDPVGFGSEPLMIGAQQVVCLSLTNAVPHDDCAPAIPPRGRAPPAGKAETLLVDGWTLEIDGSPPVPVAVDRGWEVQGWPRFAGTGIYRLRLDSAARGRTRQLWLPDVRHTAELRADGVTIGRHVAGEARFMLPDGASALELRVRNTAANRFYAGTPFDAGLPHPSGIVCPPRLVES